MRQDVDPDKPWVGPPDYVLPTVAPLSMILARTEDVVVAVLGISVYFDSFAFAISVRTKPGTEIDISHAFSGRYGGSSVHGHVEVSTLGQKKSPLLGLPF